MLPGVFAFAPVVASCGKHLTVVSVRAAIVLVRGNQSEPGPHGLGQSNEVIFNKVQGGSHTAPSVVSAMYMPTASIRAEALSASWAAVRVSVIITSRRRTPHSLF